MAGNLYTLGRGKLYFAQYLPGTTTPGGERYLGNTPALALTISTDNLDHFSSDQGVKEKDDSVALQTNRTGSFSTDNIDPKNVALFFFGSASALAVTGATVTDEHLDDVVLDTYYQLGTTPSNPSGARALDIHTAGPPAKNIILKKASTEYVEGVDYTVDMARARVYIIPTGTIVAGDDLTVSYKTKTSTRTRIISGSVAIEGALRFVANNPKGVQIDYFLPYVKITPNGDYALKGDDWQVIPFNIEALKKGDLEAIYADGQAVTA